MASLTMQYSLSADLKCQLRVLYLSIERTASSLIHKILHGLCYEISTAQFFSVTCCPNHVTFSWYVYINLCFLRYSETWACNSSKTRSLGQIVKSNSLGNNLSGTPLFQCVGLEHLSYLTETAKMQACCVTEVETWDGSWATSCWDQVWECSLVCKVWCLPYLMGEQI